jgi:transcription elongation factor Elf1
MIQAIRNWIKDLLGRSQSEVVTDSKLETMERLSDRTNYSEQLWDTIASQTCPECSSKNTLCVTAEGGMAQNVACKECDSRYWISPIREFGAQKI